MVVKPLRRFVKKRLFPIKITVFNGDREIVSLYSSGTMNAAALKGAPPRRTGQIIQKNKNSKKTPGRCASERP